MDSDDKYLMGGLIFGIILGVCMTSLIGGIVLEKRIVSYDTMNDICYNLNQTKGIIGHMENGKLICELPSFDSTQNILFKSNNIEGVKTNG